MRKLDEARQRKAESDTRLMGDLVLKLKKLARSELDGKELMLFDALTAGLTDWKGHVASFGYNGVRTRRVTICLNAELWEV